MITVGITAYGTTTPASEEEQNINGIASNASVKSDRSSDSFAARRRRSLTWIDRSETWTSSSSSDVLCINDDSDTQPLLSKDCEGGAPDDGHAQAVPLITLDAYGTDGQRTSVVLSGDEDPFADPAPAPIPEQINVDEHKLIVPRDYGKAAASRQALSIDKPAGELHDYTRPPLIRSTSACRLSRTPAFRKIRRAYSPLGAASDSEPSSSAEHDPGSEQQGCGASSYQQFLNDSQLSLSSLARPGLRHVASIEDQMLEAGLQCRARREEDSAMDAAEQVSSPRFVAVGTARRVPMIRQRAREVEIGQMHARGRSDTLQVPGPLRRLRGKISKHFHRQVTR